LRQQLPPTRWGAVATRDRAAGGYQVEQLAYAASRARPASRISRLTDVYECPVFRGWVAASPWAEVGTRVARRPAGGWAARDRDDFGIEQREPCTPRPNCGSRGEFLGDRGASHDTAPFEHGYVESPSRQIGGQTRPLWPPPMISASHRVDAAMLVFPLTRAGPRWSRFAPQGLQRGGDRCKRGFGNQRTAIRRPKLAQTHLAYATVPTCSRSIPCPPAALNRPVFDCSRGRLIRPVEIKSGAFISGPTVGWT